MSAPAPAASAAKKSPTPAAKPAEPEEVDAISEADLFLNFGRDAQAEDVLKEALSKNPSNIPVQLKLLTIYANRKDINSFTSIARQIKDSGDAAAWEQASALGRAIDPSSPMYGSADEKSTAAAIDVLAEASKPTAMPALDMDIGFNIPMDLDVTSAVPAVDAAHAMDFDVSGHAASSMDFDVTSSHANVTEVLLPDFDVTGSHQNVPEAQHMDFDVTGSQPNLGGTQHMDFDVTGSHPNVTSVAQQMDFDVTGSHPNVTAQQMDFDVTGSHPDVLASFTPEDNMSTVVLSAPMDMDISASPAASPSAPAASSSFGGMDFDISSSPSAASPAPVAASPSFSGMDFDISSSPPAASPAPAAALPSMGGMDFDISSSSQPVASPAAAAASPSMSGMDFDISSSPQSQGAKADPVMDLGLGGISLDLGEADTVVFPVAEAKKDERYQEIANKLDLARAFQEMGDVDTARELLGEVMNEGDAQQSEAARTLIQQL